jgi:hypothetical protein
LEFFCFLRIVKGHAIVAVSRRLLMVAACFDPRSGHMGFVVKKVALGQVSSEYFGFPFQLPFHQMLHILCHLGVVQ